MKKNVSPFIVFVVLQLLIITSLVLWIVWHLAVRSEYEGFIKAFQGAYAHLEFTGAGHTTMVGGIIIFSLTLISSTIIFFEWLHTRSMFSQGLDFISAFTHELMTPLTCIQMNLESMLISFELNNSQKKFLLESAFKESKRLQNSIRKILEIKRIEHRKRLIKFTLIEAQKFLNSYLAHVLKEYNEAQIELSLKFKDKVKILIDERALFMAFDNIVENAIKYSDDWPHIDLIGQINEKKELDIIFKDKGIGIEQSELKKIFEIFYRKNRNIRGSGLGLYITNNIIKLHKGKIKAFSKGQGLRQGSTFMISLPLKD